MKIKKLVATIGIGLLLGGLTGCTAKTTNKTTAAQGSVAAIKEAGVIRIGIFSDDAPFCYQDADGSFKGYDVVLGERIAEELLGDKSKIKWVTVSPADRIAYLQTNKVDLMLADFTVTEDRAKSVDFTLPYEKVSLGVVSKASAPITAPEQLNGKALAVNTGTTADVYFTNNYTKVNVLKIDAITDAFQALVSGRAIAFAQDNTLLLSWAKKNPGYVVGIKELGTKDYIAGAVKKGNTDLLNYVNDLIKGELKTEQFFHKAYEDTLKASFPDETKADDIVIEGGEKN